MNHDHYAQIWIENINQQGHLDRKFRNVLSKYGNAYIRIKVMALGISDIDIKNQLKNDEYKNMILNEDYDEFISSQLSLMDSLLLRIPHYEPENLPRSSFFLHVDFTLRKPHISRGDEEFYIHKNPVTKEKIFKIPYIRASSWKGNLRWAVKRLFGDSKAVIRIFGNEKGEKDQENLKKGRLHIYPTFFSRIGLDIINPHDRKTKTGKNPILLEVVPEGTKGDLYLLYVPFDKIGEITKGVRRDIEEDLLILCKAVKVLLTDYGMSAKRTSGYGAADIGNIDFKSIFLKEYEKYNQLDELIQELELSKRGSR